MNYSVDGSMFLVINQRFIPCNNALRKFSPWSACRVKWTRVPYHEFWGCLAPKVHTFSRVPVGRERCYSHHSVGSLALSGSCIMSSLILVCTSPRQSPVADVPGRLGRWCCQHLSRCYQTHTCVHNIIRGTHTSSATGHELPPVRKQS